MRNYVVRLLSLSATIGLALTPGLYGQESATASSPAVISEACQGVERRQFDFWIGDWTVSDPQGQIVGANTIAMIGDGCGLLESWRSAGGNTGSSINMYDPGTGQWSQTWVGGGGLILHLHGGLEDGSMVLEGEREGPEGKVTDRLSWTPNEDGSVRQHWQVSNDGGETFQTAFDGRYTKR